MPSLILMDGQYRMVGWCESPWLTSSAGASYSLDDSRARAYCACSTCGWGCLDIFVLLYLFTPLSPSLRETARFRLEYCLKGPLNPKQPTNHLIPTTSVETRRVKRDLSIENDLTSCVYIKPTNSFCCYCVGNPGFIDCF